ncbi:unnamed protein product [Candida verbasci]|uniref:Coatomer subunit zeta n=1 Tax=Candida verbasci TaxID=1227364 RepID=A0A9W4XJ53_9ASCO|nr:unnamed protein product [Candida verbasci]
MSLNLSLYTISSVLILDNEGKRLFAKYYKPTLPETNNTFSSSQFDTKEKQLKFESTLFSKINKINQDILIFENNLICYKQVNDIIIIFISPLSENESLVYSTLSNFNEALLILFDNSIDKLTLLEKYDLLCLCLDEIIDDGIIIEYDPATIVSRVTKPHSNQIDVNNLRNIDISEKGLFNALSFASKKLGERLQQGL